MATYFIHMQNEKDGNDTSKMFCFLVLLNIPDPLHFGFLSFKY